ncbi:MAG: hypothetical protein ACK5M1_01345 [Xanthomarina gelatinilytica]
MAHLPGATVSKIVTKKKGGSATLFSFNKGQNLSEHAAPFDAIVIILDRKCENSIAGEQNSLTSIAGKYPTCIGSNGNI